MKAKRNKCPYLYGGCPGDCGSWCTAYNKYNHPYSYKLGWGIGIILGHIVRPFHNLYKKGKLK